MHQVMRGWVGTRQTVTVSFLVRRYCFEDAEPTHAVFRAAVTGTASASYTPEQIAAWCPPEHDVRTWADRRARAWTLVAEDAGVVIGFGDLTDTAELDMLFVHPDAGGRGVARALVTGVLAEARRRGLPRVVTHASRPARPVFERLGFRVDAENPTNLIRGVAVPNFDMHIDLG